MSDKAKFETGTYSADDILDWYDENTNETYINSLKKSDRSTFDEVIEYEDDGITYEIGTVNGVSVILSEKKKPEIFGQDLDTLKAAGDKSLDILQATPEFLADMLNPKNIAKGMNQGVVNAFQLVDSLTGGSVTKLDNYFTENFPNTLGKKIEYKQPEGAGGVTGSIIGQYVVPGIGLLKLLRGSVLLSEPLLVGAFSSKDEGNMANLFKNMFPDFTRNNEAANIIINGLIANEDDSEVIGRLKNIAADSPIAFAFEGIFKIYKSLYKNKEAIEEIKSVGAAATPKDAPTPVEVVDSSGQTIKQTDQVVQSDKPFYSNVEKTISNFKFKQQPGNQILATLNNTAGIKQSEIEDLGLNEFLKDKPNVTKEELDDFIADKSLTTRVNETILDSNVETTQLDFSLSDDAPDILKKAKSKEEAFEIFYNEMRDPDLLREFEEFKTININQGNIQTNLEHFEDFMGKKFNMMDVKELSGTPTKFNSSQLVEPGGDNYKEMLITVPGTPQVFTKHHFKGEVPSGENLIAHARFNDRIINDKKILFIEEIQSDLHQLGRKRGYKKNRSEAERGKLLADQVVISDKIKAVQDKMFVIKEEPSYNTVYVLDGKGELVETFGNNNQIKNVNVKANAAARADELNQQAGYTAELKKLQDEAYEIRQQFDPILGVADAPFKKNWYELTMKRLIKYAIDNGYDGVAFTSGNMQKSRYMGMDNPEGLAQFYDNTLTKFTNKFAKKYDAQLETATMPGSVTKFNEVNPNVKYSAGDSQYSLVPQGGGYTLVQDRAGISEVVDFYDDLVEGQKDLIKEIKGFNQQRPFPILYFNDNFKEILTEGVPIAQVEERENKQQTTAIV